MGIRASGAHPWELNTAMASEHHDPYAGVPMVNHGRRTTYMVLLRGINVGGAHRLAMADLHAVCAAAGCTDVRTYIQSGNVVLSSAQPSANLTVELERRISTHAGFAVPVVVRTSVEWASVVRRCPFDTTVDPTKLVVWFASGSASTESVAQIESLDVGAERCVAVGSEAYLWLPQGQAGSKLVQALGRTPFGKASTARNWRTILALDEMATS